MKFQEVLLEYRKIFYCQGHVPVFKVLDLFFQSDRELTYLIHANEPIMRSNGAKVQHYIGSTIDIDRRVKQHRRKVKKGGAALMREFNRRKIDWYVVKVWKANRAFEQALKKGGHYDRYCPVCHDAVSF